MSRRSLRLHTAGGRYGDDSLADLSLGHSESYCSVDQKESSMARRWKRQQSSQSLSLTPRRAQEGTALLGQDSLHSCSASDTFLLTSMLDESCVSERTLIESFWGLDEDVELRDRNALGDHGIHTVQTQTTMLNDFVCDDCAIHSEWRDVLAAGCVSATHVDTDGAVASPVLPVSTVYSRKHRPGVLASLSDAYLQYSRRLAVSAASVVALLVQTVLLKMKKEGKGVLGALCDTPLRYVKSAGSSVTSVICRLVRRVKLKAGHRGRAVRDGGKTTNLFHWLGAGWYQLATLMSLLDVFILTRCLPKLYRVLLLLLPLLLIWGLWHRNASSLLVSDPELPTSVEQVSKEAEGHRAVTAAQGEGEPAGSVDSTRLGLLEWRVAQLWKSVRHGGRSQERLRALARHRTLLEQLERRMDRADLDFWVSGLLERKLGSLREELLQGAVLGGQVATGGGGKEGSSLQQRSTASRLTDVEALLQGLQAKTEQVLQRQASATPLPVSTPVNADHEVHRSLLEKVQRLEGELGLIRQELQGVRQYQGSCEQLDVLQDRVSMQVKQELRMLFYGSEEAGRGEPPAPLLPWLSAHFASGSDLRGALAALERSFLKNISMWTEQSNRPPCTQTVSRAVAYTAEAAGMSEEQVQLIVQNALRLYSQDRTGLADYALESGGGSILSIRCSETYETRMAIMSLFGIPLWYFTQSPRVVIQPDVHPGNCWAFKGSTGFLVIRLSLKIIPRAFSLEHLPKALSPTGNISSAPRHFAVYGLENEHQDLGVLLGNHTYQEDGDSLQTFLVSEQNEQAFQIIELRVLSNWGHPDYTCLYRFRVHGEPSAR